MFIEVTRKIDSSSIIQYKKRRYSFPSIFRGDRVSIIETDNCLKIIGDSYCRKIEKKVTTIYLEDYICLPEIVENSVEEILYTAALIGPYTMGVVRMIIKSKKHPYLAYRTIEALFYLAEKYSEDKVEEVALYSLEVSRPYYYFIKNKLKKEN